MKFKCCICKKEVDEYGNNPWPVVEDEDAICCDLCNSLEVVPARIRKMMETAYVAKQSE